MTAPADPSNPRPSTERPPSSSSRQTAAWRRFEPPAGALLTLPDQCANCGAPAGASLKLAAPLGSSGREILVPYCARCAGLAESFKTRTAVGTGLGLLIGLVALLALPMTGLALTPLGYAGLTAMGTALPIWGVWSSSHRKRVAQPCTSADYALWWDKGGLVGTNASWMEQLAASSLSQTSEVTPRRRAPVAGYVLPLTTGAMAPALFHVLFPTLVVLNLSAEEFELYVDGERRGAVGVTSLESTSAGTRLSIGAGPHVLEARPRSAALPALSAVSSPDQQNGDPAPSAGETLRDDLALAPLYHRAEVRLDAGGEYLFAPGAEGFCFWLQRTSYGRLGGESRMTPLGGKAGFYRIPSPIDTWFGPNPDPNSDDASTGGEMVALRHGRCTDSPSASDFTKR